MALPEIPTFEAVDQHSQSLVRLNIPPVNRRVYVQRFPLQIPLLLD